MSHPVTRELLSAYVDGELPPNQAAEISEHLTSCEACAGTYDAMSRTVQTLREGLVRYRAPDVLRARIRTALREEHVGDPPVARRRLRAGWRAVAAVLVTAVASSGLTMLALGRQQSAPSVSEQVLASHIRSLMPEHLTDVRSNDQHNVKPWFNGRLDLSPVVPRLDDEGFPLLGGRVDYVRDRPVAVVVYGRRLHVINVFSWPADAGADASASLEARHGYNLLHWRRQGVEYWVASDLNVAELRQFATLLEGAEPAAAAPAPR